MTDVNRVNTSFVQGCGRVPCGVRVRAKEREHGSAVPCNLRLGARPEPQLRLRSPTAADTATAADRAAAAVLFREQHGVSLPARGRLLLRAAAMERDGAQLD